MTLYLDCTAGICADALAEALRGLVGASAASPDVSDSVGAVCSLLDQPNAEENAQIAEVCRLMALLAPEEVLASPVRISSPQALGTLLEDVHVCGAGARCTRAGLALVKHFANGFGELPEMAVQKAACGSGGAPWALWGAPEERVLCLSCNLDDMTGEAVGFAMERLLALGALDVFTQAIGMKKSRPAVLLTVLCRPAEREKMVRALFANTTTLGIRESIQRRYTLSRRFETVQTPHGPVRCKVASGYGVVRRKAEYEDLARIARETGAQLGEIE